MFDQKQLHVEDGKLIVYVQKDNPADPNQLKNWLSARKDDFRFAATFYGLRMPLVDGSYKMTRPVKTNRSWKLGDLERMKEIPPGGQAMNKGLNNLQRRQYYDEPKIGP